MQAVHNERWITVGVYGRARHARLALLPAALAAVLAPALAAAAPFDADMPSGAVRGNYAGVAALFQTLHEKRASRAPSMSASAPHWVTRCDDIDDPGALRAVVTAAADGDTVDLSTLTCGPILLTQGVIPVYADSLLIAGKSATETIIDGNAADRVFAHVGYDRFTLSNLTVRNGYNRVEGLKVAGGACILSYGNTVLDHATVRDCTSVGEGSYGGAILASNIDMQMSTLTGNTARGSLLTTLTASYGGGAFAYHGTIDIRDSIVSGNRALPDPANIDGSYDTGAGLFADRGGSVLRSAIYGNYTDGTGGGIATHGELFLIDSTVSGNTATRKAGGGIFARGFGTLNVIASTVAFNSAARAGGIYEGGFGSFTLESSIVADNFAGSGVADIASLSAQPIIGAHNLVVAADSAVIPGDTLRADPQLLPLGFNGGFAPTHGIGPRSPAIDAGDNTFALDTDQRGAPFPRVYGAAADIGAFEFSKPDLVFHDDFGDD